jgi:PAS domain S-box-containing protein
MNDPGYRLLFEANPQPIFVIDLETFAFLDVNDAAVRDYGYSREQFREMTALDIRPSDDVANFSEHFAKLLAQTHTRALANMRGWKHQRQDGSIFDVEVGWSHIQYNGREACMIVVRDVTAQRRTEDELRNSAEQFRTLFRHVPVPTCCWRAKGDDFELVSYNDAAEEISRGAIRNWLGITASKMYPDLPQIPADFAICVREKRNSRKNIKYRFRSTKEERDISVVYTYVPPDMVMAHVEDISERLASERALQRTEERFYKAFHANPAAILISAVESGEIIDANESFCQIYGFRRDEVVGKISLELGIWPSAEERERLIRLLKAEGRLRNQEATVCTKSGENRFVNISTEFLDLDNRDCILSILQDITERKLMEERLRYNERLKRQVLDSVPGGVVYVDCDGCMRDANTEAQRLLGLSHNETTQTYVSDFSTKTIWEDGTPCEVKDYPVAKCLATQQAQPKATIGVMKPDGSITWGVYAATPVFAQETGLFSGAVVSFLDVTPRKLAEEALRESELRFRQLAENIHEVFWMCDARLGTILYVSPAYAKVWKRTCESLYLNQASYLASIHPDDLQTAKIAQQQHRSGLQTEAEYRITQPDGSVRWIRDRGFPIFGPDGTVERVAGIAEDITEYRRALCALQESETKYRTLAETTGVGIWQITEGGETIYLNPAMCAFLGVSDPATVLGRRYVEFFTPDSLRIITSELQKRKKGIASNYEVEMVRADGSRRNMLVFGGPFFTPDGNLHSILGSFIDITDRKRAEQEASNLVSLVQNTSDFVGIASMEGKVTFVNDGGRKLVGLSLDYDVGEFTIAGFLTPEALQINQLVEIPAVQEFGFWRGETTLRHFQTGKTIPVQVVSLLLRHPETGQPIGLATIQRDITARMEAEHALQDYAERLRNLSSRLLEAQETERRHIARELHDEIGQTLTATKLNLQAAQRVVDPAILEEKLTDGIRLVERLLDQVRNLSLDLCPPQLDFLGLVPALRSYVEEQGERAGLHVQFFADETMDRPKPLIEIACFRVAQEAITNVIRHAKARNLSVRLLQDVEALHLYVRDDGTGFDFAAARQRAGRGESLGILGMEERAVLLGGQLTCRSSPGNGTEVHAWFPLETAVNQTNEITS